MSKPEGSLDNFGDLELVHGTARGIRERFLLSESWACDVCAHHIKDRHGMSARLGIKLIGAELVNVPQDAVELILILHRLLGRESEARELGDVVDVDAWGRHGCFVNRRTGGARENEFSNSFPCNVDFSVLLALMPLS